MSDVVDGASRARSCVQRSLDPRYNVLLLLQVLKVRMLSQTLNCFSRPTARTNDATVAAVPSSLLESSDNTLSADPRKCCQIVSRSAQLQCFEVESCWEKNKRYVLSKIN